MHEMLQMLSLKLMMAAADPTVAAATEAAQESEDDIRFATFIWFIVAAVLYVGLYFYKHRHRKGDYFDRRKDMY